MTLAKDHKSIHRPTDFLPFAATIFGLLKINNNLQIFKIVRIGFARFLLPTSSRIVVVIISVVVMVVGPEMLILFTGLTSRISLTR